MAVVDDDGRLIGEVPHYALLMAIMGEETGDEIVKLNGDVDTDDVS